MLMRFVQFVFPFVFRVGSRKSGGEGLGERGDQWTEVVSWEPRAFIFHNFLVSFRFGFS